MFYRLTTRIPFWASHQLIGMHLGHPASKLHGHSYMVEVTLGSGMLSKQGTVADTKMISDVIQETFNYKHLNDVFAKRGETNEEHLKNPTLENIAAFIAILLNESFLGAPPEEVAHDIEVLAVSVQNEFTTATFLPPKLDLNFT